MARIPPPPPPPFGGIPPEINLPLSGGTQYRAALAAELVVDVEGRRLPIEQVLYKARRLANMVGATEVEEWLGYELGGYASDLPPEIEVRARQVGRAKPVPRLAPVDKGESKSGSTIKAEDEPKRNLTYREGLPRLETAVLPNLDEAAKRNLATAQRVRNRASLPGQRGMDPARWEEAVPRIYLEAITIREIGQRVRTEIHRFATEAYHRFSFQDVASSIFERHKKVVDGILSRTTPDVVEKIPSIYDRLADTGDAEAVSQAMSTTRRMIAAFADAVYPPRADPVVDEEGGTHELRQERVLNRIQQALRERCASRSRRDRLASGVRKLYERVSAGMKTDVTADEAQSLFLATYLMLGEIAIAVHVEESELR